MKKKGYEIVPFEKGADLYIINTCAVTSESERKSAQLARRAISFGTGRVIVAGCSSQLHPEKYLAEEGVTFVCGNRDKLFSVISSLIESEKRVCEHLSLDGASYEEMKISGSERTRAYIKVEDGCDANCAYCIIKTARGRIRSRKITDAIDEVKRLAEKGYREIVFCGIEISGFGSDTGEELSELVRLSSEVEGIERIRLSSVDPSFLRRGLIDKLSSIEKFMPYFHISLQSGCDATLARMRRRYNTQRIRENLSYIREKMPDTEFFADIIVGFPGESDEDFEKTCDFVKEIGLCHFHIFTYSKRPGTEAATMPCQVSPEVKRKREKSLSLVREEVGRASRSKYIGRIMTVLFETYSDGVAKGHTKNFIEVSAKSSRSLHGEFKDVLITDVTSDGCIGIVKE